MKQKAEILGSSPPMANLCRGIEKAAQGTLTVLIQGESGTGKGMVARAIHDASRRAAAPFVMVNCGAIPDSLMESELFGCEPGAFTGAVRQKKGKFEAAHHGTLFLDEIGELSLPSQASLLHVLQEREVERLGGEGKRINVDVRVVAATNRNLDQMVEAGMFREDLFFRLNVFPIATPTLRDRRQDIRLLAEYYLRRSAQEAGRNIRGVSAAVLEEFENHAWPGNVRQLENVIQRAVAMGETDEVLLEDLPAEFLLSRNRKSSSIRIRKIHEALDETAREICIAAFAASKGDAAQAAQMMGIHRSSIYRLVRRHRLDYLLGAAPGREREAQLFEEGI